MDHSEVIKLIEAQGKAWADFQKANDERLKAIETKGFAPADLVQKVDAINADVTKTTNDLKEAKAKLDAAEKVVGRLALAPGKEGKQITPEQAEYKAALRAYLRDGVELPELKALEKKAMTRGNDKDGGYLVDEEMDAMIDRFQAAQVSFRSLCNVRTIGMASYKKLVKTRGVAGGWLGETEASSEQTGPQYSEIEIVPWRLYAEPWVYNEMLEDSQYDLEADLAQEAAVTFGETEGTAFINGTGVKQPRGFLAETPVANASFAWGSLGFIVSGAAAALATSNPSDAFINVQHALKPGLRNGATWLMSDATLATVRQVKDASGRFYLWNPDPAGGFSGQILGAPVATDDYMPAIAANAYPIAFGNFRRGYTIVDRRGTVLIRDVLTAKGTTKFHFSRRVGGGVTNFEAIKLMKIST